MAKELLTKDEDIILPTRCTVTETDNGGFIAVTVIAQDKFLSFTIATVSGDGLIELIVSIMEFPSHAMAPEEEQLESMAHTLHSSGEPPSSFEGNPMEWNQVKNSSSIQWFASYGHLEIKSNEHFVPVEIAAARIRDRLGRLSENEGSLAWHLSKHHDDISHHLALASTDMPWAVEHMRSRPWMFEIFLNDFPSDCRTPEILTAEKLAKIVSMRKHSEDSVSPAAIRWCDRFFADNVVLAPGNAFLEFLTALPRSWWPIKADDYNTLCLLASRILDMCDSDTVEAIDMLRPAKGRFSDYVSSIGDGIKPAWFSEHKEYGDPSEYRRECLFRVDYELRDCNDLLASIDTHLVSPFRGPRGKQDTLKAARQIVTKGGGIRRYIEASKRWHELPPMQGKFNTPEHAWARCVGSFSHDGIEVVELCTAEDLWKEGLRLDHCVGGDHYVVSCMSGFSRIVSLRIDGNSISTAEILHDGIRGKYSVIQHRGVGNSAPQERATKALKAWSRAVNSGAVTSYTIIPVPMPEIEEVELPGYGPAAWRPMIRRDLASLSWEEFGKQVMELCKVDATDEHDPAILGSGM